MQRQSSTRRYRIADTVAESEVIFLRESLAAQDWRECVDEDWDLLKEDNHENDKTA